MKLLIPEFNKKIVLDIVRSWRAPASNYILVAPPLAWGEEILSSLCSLEIHGSEKYKPGELAIAYFRSGEIKDALEFAEAVAKKWGVDSTALGKYRDSTEILSYSVQEVCRNSQRAIIIIGGFHQAIEKLSWDVGATLRNLEHEFGLCTVVEMPIKLSSLRSRWELFKTDVPFLASDFGQGHSTRVLGVYDETEIGSVLRAFGLGTEISSQVFDLSGGIPLLVHWLARNATESKGTLHVNELLFEAKEQFMRMLKWLDAPGKSTWFDLLSTFPGKDRKGLSFSDHEWCNFLVDSKTLRIRSLLLTNNLVNSTEPSTPQNPSLVSTSQADTLTVVFLATAWGPIFGGINSFNLECCQNISRLLDGRINVVCIVPCKRAIVESSHDVNVIFIREDGGNDFDESDVPVLVAKLKSFGRFVVVGHDVKTGLLSNSLGSLAGAEKKIVFCHMAYDSYYPLVAKGVVSKSKHDQQCKAFIGADFVLGVGPKLTDYVNDCLRSVDRDVRVSEYVPRLLRDSPVSAVRITPKITFIGRIEPTRDIIKQSRMALLAIAKAIRNTKTEIRDICVQFIGAAAGNDDEDNIRSELNKLSERPVACNYFDYIDNRTVALRAIRDSSLVVMPSFHEGFGLVAWEAISIGVPVIISDNSGLYELLDKLGLSSLVGSLHISGNDPAEDSTETAVFCDLIKERLLHPGRFHREAAELRSKLEVALGNLSSNAFYSEILAINASERSP